MPAPAEQIETDVCIIGSGVAGMLCAVRLAERFQHITVLERGQRTELAESNQRRTRNELPFARTDLGANYARSVGRHPEPYNTQNSVGGSTLRWWGHAPRLAPADFALASRYGVGVDWPIDHDAIEPWYCEAERELAIAGDAAAAPWPRSRPYPLPPHPLSPHEEILAGELGALGVKVSSMPLGRLSREHQGRPACCGSATCSIVCPTDAKYTALNTHVPAAERTGRVAIRAGVRAHVLVPAGGRIARLLAIDGEGRRIEVSARLFLLAANAVENARILLQSAAAAADFAANPLTGRCFMDHPALAVRGWAPRDLQRGYGPTPSNGVSFDFYDGPFRSTRAAGTLELSNLRLTEEDVAAPAVAALKAGKRGGALWDAVSASWRGSFEMSLLMELLPDPANAITLSSGLTDPFGWPFVDIALDAWPDYVARSAAQFEEVARRLAARLGGRVEVQPRYESRHFMGTCRMGRDRASSVVDPDLRHHDYDNLYVLGSAVFPTCGAGSPTLLGAALSLRCAEHLLGRFGK